MKLDISNRKIATMSWAAAALIMCAIPSFAQDEDSEAAPAQQGGRYEAHPNDGQSEMSEPNEEPARIQPLPAATRTVPRVSQARHAVPNQGETSPGEGSLPGADVSHEPASPSAVQSCAWRSLTSPTPESPTIPCSSDNEGAASRNSKNQGNFTCMCANVDSGGSSGNRLSSGSTGSGASSGGNGQGSAPAGCSISPVTWGPGLDGRAPSQGGTPRQTVSVGGMQAFRMTGTSRQPGFIALTYSTCHTQFSVSANACDWEKAGQNCLSGGADPNIVVQTSDIPPLSGACVMKAGKNFYLNVRPIPGQMMGDSCTYRLSY